MASATKPYAAGPGASQGAWARTPGSTGREPGFNILDIHGQRYHLPLMDGSSETKERILMSATILFARHGYAAVSIRDIAKANNIKPSSIYNHFESKEALWAAALEHLGKLNSLYFEHLEQVVDRARTFEEFLAVIFHEPKMLGNHFINYGLTLMTLEQVNDPQAAEAFHGIFTRSVNFIREKCDGYVARGQVRPFDTRVVANLIMSTIHIGLIAKVQEIEGGLSVFQTEKVAADLERFILWAVAKEPQTI